ncbi:hypothetical protein [Pedobacter sp. CFBP9032]|uniref:hypothetical protein n=1 Tax=Pedobacter sp. CFBP9032 TaxID=3096539 RepID=UPI002A6B55FB|nr:hypothetical protein [Pedobacter sp. CFBP9032]MDY0906578.1 hypothetical protein [Pedobacter sp. CFBP9032]
MIPIPTLPSDSLYKFLFIGGLLLFGLSIWLIADERKREFEMEVEYDTKLLPQAQNAIYMDSLYAERIRNYYKGLEKVTTKEDKRFYWQRIDDLDDKVGQLGTTVEYAKQLEKLHQNSHSNTTWNMNVLVAIGSLGLMGALLGWTRWSKQQNVQDDFILQQFALQKLEVQIKTLELQQNLDRLEMSNMNEGRDVSSDLN